MKELIAQKRRGDPDNGFTLIELLIVVIIIGILAAVSIPIFANQQQAAQRAKFQSDVRNFAAILYQSSYDQRSNKLHLTLENGEVVYHTAVSRGFISINGGVIEDMDIIDSAKLGIRLTNVVYIVSFPPAGGIKMRVCSTKIKDYLCDEGKFLYFDSEGGGFSDRMSKDADLAEVIEILEGKYDEQYPDFFANLFIGMIE